MIRKSGTKQTAREVFNIEQIALQDTISGDTYNFNGTVVDAVGNKIIYESDAKEFYVASKIG